MTDVGSYGRFLMLLVFNQFGDWLQLRLIVIIPKYEPTW